MEHFKILKDSEVHHNSSRNGNSRWRSRKQLEEINKKIVKMISGFREKKYRKCSKMAVNKLKWQKFRASLGSYRAIQTPAKLYPLSAHPENTLLAHHQNLDDVIE